MLEAKISREPEMNNLLRKQKTPSEFKVRDLVLVKIRRKTFIDDRAYDLKDTTGHDRCASLADI